VTTCARKSQDSRQSNARMQPRRMRQDFTNRISLTFDCLVRRSPGCAAREQRQCLCAPIVCVSLAPGGVSNSESV
jgi:hypothetical protein